MGPYHVTLPGGVAGMVNRGVWTFPSARLSASLQRLASTDPTPYAPDLDWSAAVYVAGLLGGTVEETRANPAEPLPKDAIP